MAKLIIIAKDFFRLDKRKTTGIFAVAAVYFSAVFLSGFLTPIFGGTFVAAVLGTIFLGIISVGILPITIFKFDIMSGSIATRLITTGVLVLWWYVISCLAVFIYNKVKRAR